MCRINLVVGFCRLGLWLLLLCWLLLLLVLFSLVLNALGGRVPNLHEQVTMEQETMLMMDCMHNRKSNTSGVFLGAHCTSASYRGTGDYAHTDLLDVLRAPCENPMVLWDYQHRIERDACGVLPGLTLKLDAFYRKPNRGHASSQKQTLRCLLTLNMAAQHAGHRWWCDLCDVTR